MKRPSAYLKMQVLGAIEVAPGETHHARIQNVAEMTFLDEEGNQRQFTWRTIQTWYYRYKNHGITGVNAPARADKGKPRKVTPEEVLEAINAVLPHFHAKNPTRTAIYRFCIEKGLLNANQIARNTFIRMVNKYELLSEDPSENKSRQAFCMQYANTVKILCEAFKIEFESSAFKCERKRIEQAFRLNRSGKMLVTVIDDAHLMDMENLRKLRLLLEDFPKNHNNIDLLMLLGHDFVPAYRILSGWLDQYRRDLGLASRDSQRAMPETS